MGTASARASVNWSGSVTVRGEYAPYASRSRRCWSPTGARSRSGSSGRCASSGSVALPSTRRPTGGARTCARPTRRTSSAPARLPRATSAADVLVETALRSGAEAIHPGYGFLAENAAFARLVEDAGLTWIGPPPAAIELMGSKTAARAAMRDAGRADRPRGRRPRSRPPRRSSRWRAEIGYPLIIKAAAGGGGKGMEIVDGPADAERAFDAATRQGEKYFADATVYVERYIEDPRHVEVQVLADTHGNVIHLGERDCTIQRRHQKLVEETPSPAVDDALRARIGQIAVDAARAAGYRSAGTVEGLLTREGDYFFMEMNTRIQVEHTVTEAVTGLDLVREQVLVAAGEPLSIGAGRRGAPRARDRVPDQRGGRLEGIPAHAGPDHRVSRACGPRGPGRLGDRGGGRGERPLRPDDREADRPRRRPGARHRPHAARARRVPDRGADDAPRLPPGVARAPLLRARRDVRRRGRVGRAGAACAGARAVVLSSDNKCRRSSGRIVHDGSAPRGGGGRRALVRRPAPRHGAALGCAGPASARAGGRRPRSGAATAPW